MKKILIFYLIFVVYIVYNCLKSEDIVVCVFGGGMLFISFLFLEKNKI